MDQCLANIIYSVDIQNLRTEHRTPQTHLFDPLRHVGRSITMCRFFFLNCVLLSCHAVLSFSPTVYLSTVTTFWPVHYGGEKGGGVLPTADISDFLLALHWCLYGVTLGDSRFHGVSIGTLLAHCCRAACIKCVFFIRMAEWPGVRVFCYALHLSCVVVALQYY